ncbi:MAG: DegT/DnrJ/EryC1/StrS family aminotransferase [Anaerolineales bacterium]|nr:DegT/DnrJ/EryC1/StrS family aminotransferase [Anaerolineales bacterium]
MIERLAIDGGTPVLSADAFKPWPIITEDDRKLVNQVLDSGIISGGKAPQVKALEEEWAKYVGLEHCLTTCSGTAALHMALAALGVGPGDEVITSAFTFLASASCALHQNAIPVFVDVDPKTFCMDPHRLEEAITERTRAIIPVHIQGLAANMDAIMAIARKHNLPVVEDACQAHGALYKEKLAGTFGDIGVWSLNSLKNLTGGEGGLLASNNPDLIKKATLVRAFGDDVDEVTQRRIYNASILGYMYRNQELSAALARGQLIHLDERNWLRIANAEYLTRELDKIPGIIPPYCPPECKHVYFMYNVRFSPQAAGIDANPRQFRIAVEKALTAEGVLVGQWQTMPVPAQDLFQSKLGYGGSHYPWSVNETRGIEYRYDPDDYPVAKQVCDTYTVVHGIHPPNSINTMEKIVYAFRKVFSNLDIVMNHAGDDIQAWVDYKLYGTG